MHGCRVRGKAMEQGDSRETSSRWHLVFGLYGQLTLTLTLPLTLTLTLILTLTLTLTLILTPNSNP
jgi:hypothetical protein